MGTIGVNPPKTPVTKGSNGVAAATLPNVCKMPSPPAPFVPTPLPNIGRSSESPEGYSKSVKFDADPVAIRGATFSSQGDIASKGTGGGIASANTHGITKFVGPGSMDVQVEGRNVQLLSDPMLNNCGAGGSPPNAATMTGVIQVTSIPDVGSEETCPNCKAAQGRNNSDGEKYEDFFSTLERTELDAIAANNLDLVAMLPPKNGVYKVRSSRDTRAAREKYEKKKKKAGMKGEYHHPHPLKIGGCPIHQQLVEKPVDPVDKARVDAVDNQINDVVNQAIARH